MVYCHIHKSPPPGYLQNTRRYLFFILQIDDYFSHYNFLFASAKGVFSCCKRGTHAIFNAVQNRIFPELIEGNFFCDAVLAINDQVFIGGINSYDGRGMLFAANETVREEVVHYEQKI